MRVARWPPAASLALFADDRAPRRLSSVAPLAHAPNAHSGPGARGNGRPWRARRTPWTCEVGVLSTAAGPSLVACGVKEGLSSNWARISNARFSARWPGWAFHFGNPDRAFSE